MKTCTPPHPAIDLATPLYYQLVYTLTDLLPPPLDDTPEALRARNHAAIAKVAALLPVNANEVDLAPSFACSVAQCIAARAQAEELLRLIRQNADDIGLVMRLNAQYASMVRTSLSVLGRLMRVQSSRQKREVIDGAANQDTWAQHVVERSMLLVTHPDAEPPQAELPKAPPVATRIEPAATSKNQLDAQKIQESKTNSQAAAFETWLSAQPRNLGSRGSSEPGLRQVLRAAMAKAHLAGPQLPADRRESPGRVETSSQPDWHPVPM